MWTNSAVLMVCIIFPRTFAQICRYGGRNLFNYHGECLVELYHGSFDEAVAACRNLNGFLPTIHDDEQQYELSATVKSAYPNGYLSSNPDADTTIWLGWKNGTWTDGSLVDYSGNLGNERPNLLVLKRELNQEGTLMTPDSRASSVCLYEPELPTACPKITNTNNWALDIDDKQCYSISPEQSFAAADTRCRNLHMYLPTIINSRDNQFVYNFARRREGAFLWLNYMKNSINWLSGEEMDYKNFCTDNTDSDCRQDNSNNELCLGMILRGKNADKWSYFDCANVSALTVCQSDAQLS